MRRNYVSLPESRAGILSFSRSAGPNPVYPSFISRNVSTESSAQESTVHIVDPVNKKLIKKRQNRDTSDKPDTSSGDETALKKQRFSDLSTNRLSPPP